MGRRRAAGVVTAAGLAVAAAGVWGGFAGTTVRAQTPLQSAEGDSYIAQGIVHLLGSPTPTLVGPLAPTSAYVPGGPPSTSASIAACTGCISTVLDRLQAGLDTAAATTTTAGTTNCLPNATPPAGITNGPFTGGNGCSNLTGVGLLGPSPAIDTITADAVNVQALAQSCDGTPTGFTNIANLKIAGVVVQLPPIIKPNTDLASLLPAVGSLLNSLGLQIILNEQHFDNVGHGITVNAIHVILNGTLNGLAAADVIVAHAHASASCGSGTTNTGSGSCPSGSLGPCTVPVITKTDSVGSVAPGGTVTYTISIAQKAGCPITRIVDILPFGFTPGTASGDFGSATTGSVAGTGQAMLTWQNVNGIQPNKNPIVETLTASVDNSLTAGLYINQVDILSAKCGEGHGQDNGIAVTGVAGASTSPTPSLANTAGASAPGSGSATGGFLIVGGGLLGLAGVSLILRRRRSAA